MVKARHKDHPALVFNCNYNGLSIIQALGRKGVQVYALDTIRSIGTYSKYAKFWQCPDPRSNESDFISFLLDKGPLFKYKPILIPTNDQWATAISKNKDKLQEYYIPCVANWATVELLVDKGLFYPWAMKKGYPVPRLYTLNELLNAETNVFPVVAKPKYQSISSNSQNMIELSKNLMRMRMVVLHNTHDLKIYLKTNKDILPYIVFQEYVAGMADRMYTIGIYANTEHEILGVFTGRKVRGFPPDIGDCIVGQAEKLPQNMVTLVKKIVGESTFQGIAEFEFKRSANTDEFKLIEINPRSWSWIGITPACGVNLPWIAYADLTKTETVNYVESRIDCGDIKYIKLMDDFINCLYANKKAGFPEYQMGLIQWWTSLKAKKKVYAGFSLGDPLPLIYSIYISIIEAFKSKFG